MALFALGSAATLGTHARAACVTAAGTTTCDSSAPNPTTSTVGAGLGDDGRTVEMLAGSAISVTNANGISLGDEADITLRTGSSVLGNNSGGSGNYGTGNNVIEFNINGTLLIEEGAAATASGSQTNAETVNVHGFGNVIENHGTISATSSPPSGSRIWRSAPRTSSTTSARSAGPAAGR